MYSRVLNDLNYMWIKNPGMTLVESVQYIEEEFQYPLNIKRTRDLLSLVNGERIKFDARPKTGERLKNISCTETIPLGANPFMSEVNDSAMNDL